jgi:hypothetical protein
MKEKVLKAIELLDDIRGGLSPNTIKELESLLNEVVEDLPEPYANKIKVLDLYQEEVLNFSDSDDLPF